MNMQNIKKKLLLVVLGVFSFLFFLYLSFPYGVLKEAAATQIQLATGMTVRIEELGPAFPFGFVAEGVELSSAGKAKVKFQEVGIRLSILQMFLLRLGSEVTILGENNGKLVLGIGLSILKVLTGGGFIPSEFDLEAKNFSVDGIISYGIARLVDSGAAGPMAGPLLQAVAIKGQLNGKADVGLDIASLGQSQADVNLTLANAALVLSDPTIGLPNQNFRTAQIKGQMKGGSLRIDQATKFVADELEFGLDGKINVKNVMQSSDLDLKLLVKLSGGLGDKFGWVMDGITSGASKGGTLNLQVRGTLGAPVSTPL